MDRGAELSEFLKSRRARVRPEDVGLPYRADGTRRVRGLRREELALAAGVSVSHYTRLEQGNGRNVSAEVLDAIADTLRLTGDERAYLHALARPAHRGHDVAQAPVRPGLQRVLDSLVLTPALVLGRHVNVVAWNTLAAAVFADFAAMPEERRTIGHLIFLDEGFRRMHGDGWPRLAREHVARLRVLAARYPRNAQIMEHVDAICRQSPEFGRLWHEHHVAAVTHRDYVLDHPVVGELRLSAELVGLPGDPELQGMDLFAAEPGSESEDRLRHLAATTTRTASPHAR
ncbi:helix-turn-helix transcriptional regulator [Microbispora sp. SCL1-1]|uniref:Helix-turn-helix transcriptional regulator n=1 Tax=Microbispora hainanensis TaxID=568844 RepID=A0ABZ1T0L3_9ACTN|nr:MULTISPECIES: helix-turn-helix transcriptional regulator [Microbispora]NJP23262.1 helix-turn-helix transcriptional regulator [Microbispora sp. CL1-1]TQS16343.1 helix-turn-helix transcriptional regulator [Microbispora sp. SCL1-1]